MAVAEAFAALNDKIAEDLGKIGRAAAEAAAQVDAADKTMASAANDVRDAVDGDTAAFGLLRAEMGDVDAALAKAEGQLSAVGEELSRVGNDGSEMGAKLLAAWNLADDAADRAVIAQERANAAIEAGAGDASKLAAAQGLVAKAVDLAAVAEAKSAAALKLMQGAADGAAGSERELARASLEAAAAAAVASAAEKALAAQRAADVRGARSAIDALTAMAQDEYRLGASMAVVEDAASHAAEEVDALAEANSRVIMLTKEAGAAARDAALQIAAGADTAAEATDRAVSAALRLTAAEQGAADATEALRNKIADATAMMILEADQAKILAEADAALAAGEGMAAAAAALHARAIVDATAGMDKGTQAALGFTQAVKDTGAATGPVVGWFQRWGTVIHWVIAAGAEFAAVAIPAMIALGSAAFVATQGVITVQQHMTALYTATEATSKMFHVTIGSALGLGNALQQAQNEANPRVYEALGGALSIAKSEMKGFGQVGNSVLVMIDTLIARMQYDLTGSGGALKGLLSGMAQDAQGLGQVLGNLGHAILNFAADMPGLAAVLLKVLNALSATVLAFTNLGDAANRYLGWTGGIVTALNNVSHYMILGAMAAEEFYRWGGLVVNILSRVGLAAVSSMKEFQSLSMMGKYQAIFATLGTALTRSAGAIVTFAGRAVSALGKLMPEFEAAGTAVENFGSKLTALAADPVAMSWVTLAIAAVIGLAIAFDKIRSPAEHFVDSVNQAVSSASQLQVLNVLGAGIAGTTSKLAASEVQFRAAGSSMDSFARAANGPVGPLRGVTTGMNQASISLGHSIGMWFEGQKGVEGFGRALVSFDNARGAALSINTLTAAQKQWEQSSVNVVAGARSIAHEYGVNFVGALEMAQQAGVKLQNGYVGQGEAARIAQIQVADLDVGYKAMGQDSSAVAGDMGVLAVQSGLAATKVQQLSQATQQYMQESLAARGAGRRPTRSRSRTSGPWWVTPREPGAGGDDQPREVSVRSRSR